MKSKENFIPTFLYYLSPGRTITMDDAGTLAKFDLIAWNKFRGTQIEGKTHQILKGLNPDIEIFVYIQGVDSWGVYNEREEGWINNIARQKDPKGHSMGNILDDNPDLILLDKNGNKCISYPGKFENARYLMDFGSEKYHKYWLECVETDILQQPWKADGIFLDNTGPVREFPCVTPVKYNTPEKWAEGTNRFINAVVKYMHERDQKVFINTCATQTRFAIDTMIGLDNTEYPPDLSMEEGTFVVNWWSAGTNFEPEERFRNSLEAMKTLRNIRHVYQSHTTLDRDEEGTDNCNRPVTFWQALWYGMCAFLLGKPDNNSAYFQFRGPKEPHTITWFEEFEYIDLGKPVSDYKIIHNGVINVYWREFEKGYVYVNTSYRSYEKLKLERSCKLLNHDNFMEPEKLESVETIWLRGHHGVILLKT